MVGYGGDERRRVNDGGRSLLKYIQLSTNGQVMWFVSPTFSGHVSHINCGNLSTAQIWASCTMNESLIMMKMSDAHYVNLKLVMENLQRLNKDIDIREKLLTRH
ncbi:hypothetical protein T11_4878 [Trichinella zimbabwensis]|uniref:Uncharacterized protein n=1 Tax=Trichinella zimbabwensis TaxID=268475 RepID=A0A0V1GUH4_9BILA|nr:hypothetical protein T11_4878 [Trichinella zimbabwensis]